VDPIPSFDDWVRKAHPEQCADRLWKMAAYRFAIYALELGWVDATALDRNRITQSIASQLYRALGSIAGNIAEGYSRSSGADRVRFFEYALGSTRESAVWYRAARPVLGHTIHDSRVELLSQIRRILLASIPAERVRRLRKRTAD
jgi:four helix bundle protein